MKASDTDIHRVMARVNVAAHAAGENAGMSGRMDDGGQREILAELRFYKLGFDREVPPEWEKYALQIEKESDPDYAEYLRLSKKFKGG